MKIIKEMRRRKMKIIEKVYNLFLYKKYKNKYFLSYLIYNIDNNNNIFNNNNFNNN